MLLVLAAAALFVYVRQRADLTETIDHGLDRRSDDVAALIRRSGPEVATRADGRLTDREDAFVQVLTPEGIRVGGTRGVHAPALGPEEAATASRGATRWEGPVPGIEGAARLLARPVVADRASYVLLVGVSLADREEILAGLVRSFVIGVPIAVLLASGIGYWLAAAGISPVEAMRRRAKRVSLTQVGQRLPLPAARDEIHRLGETLNEMLARLEESFQRERRFVADASHELRTPLAVLKAELEAAIRFAADDPELRESLLVALEETDHLAQLADDLLLIARAADGRLPIRPEPLNVGELLERTRQRFADRAQRQLRVIRVDAPADSTVCVDPLRARQALGNLVDNALRHGRGPIDLRAHRMPGAVQIDVADEGPGFPPDLGPRAFERFARNGDEGARSGAGLGLAIVRAIADAHGGDVEIVRSSSAGATVRLRFPALSSVSGARRRTGASMSNEREVHSDEGHSKAEDRSTADRHRGRRLDRRARAGRMRRER
jgi:two-component system OmpR family sensor kinase